MKKLINWGIMGTGVIARKFIEGLRALPEEACIYGVASRSEDKAQGFAKEFDIPYAFGSYEQMVSDPNIDVIYIAVPHPQHMECSILCMQHGKHVLCEKPLSLNKKESELMMEEAKKNHVFLMEAMWTKFLPVIRKVKELIQQGFLGDIIYMNAAFSCFTQINPDSRLYNLEQGGGALLDVGIYPISLMTYLIEGEPNLVSSQAIIGETGVDEVVSMQFTYHNNSNKIIADLNTAIRADHGTTAIIYGTKGKIVIPEFFHAQEAFWYDENSELVEHISIPHIGNGYEYEASEVMKCIREGKEQSLIHSQKDTLLVMQLMDRMRASWGLVYPREKQ